MKIRTYYQHLLRINTDELPLLPPFDAGQSMSEDKLIDILCYATPCSWMREMDRQGFDPVAKTLTKVVTFMERIKQAEDFDGQQIDYQQRSSSNHGKKKSKTAKNSKGTKHCIVHGDCTHSSEECEVLKRAAKNHQNKGTGGYSNKTWKRKAEDLAKSAKKDLASFIKKSIARGVQKELNSIDKKCKAKDNKLDLNAFDGDLKGFNYEDMDNLKIESDDETSVGGTSC